MTALAPHVELPDREDVLPLVSFIPVAGPPVFVAAGALVLATLMLAGPFLLIVTLAAAFVLTFLTIVAVIGAAVAVLASPVLLLRLLP